MKKSRHVLNRSDYEFLHFLYRGYHWVHFEPKEQKLSLEDRIRYGGKYVIYGSRERVEDLAEKLEPRIGGVIEAMKYSTTPTKVTPNAPEDQHALVVYCNKKTQSDVMKILETLDVDNFEWKSSRDSWRGDLNDTWFCFNLYLSDRDRFRKICRMVDKEKSFEVMDDFNRIASELAPEFRKVSSRLHKGSDVKSLIEELRELVEQKFMSL